MPDCPNTTKPQDQAVACVQDPRTARVIRWVVLCVYWVICGALALVAGWLVGAVLPSWPAAVTVTIQVVVVVVLALASGYVAGPIIRALAGQFRRLRQR